MLKNSIVIILCAFSALFFSGQSQAAEVTSKKITQACVIKDFKAVCTEPKGSGSEHSKDSSTVHYPPHHPMIDEILNGIYGKLGFGDRVIVYIDGVATEMFFGTLSMLANANGISVRYEL